MPQRPSTILMVGGLNLVDPPIARRGGFAISGVNYESDAEGYRRFGGYERFDSGPAPSSATYLYCEFENGEAAISSGATVTGATSGATGVALADAVVTSGSYGGADAAGYFALSTVSGTFQNGETVQITGPTDAAVLASTPVEGGAPTVALNKTYLALARTILRSAVGRVSTSGGVQGVWALSGTYYAAGNNAGGTATNLVKGSGSAWVVQTFGSYIYFDAGTAAFTVGDTLTGGTSGATATIERIIVQSGSYGGSDAAGYMVLSSVSGTFQDNETVTDAGGGSATANGADVAITIPPNGRWDVTNHNFYGALGTRRSYIATGVGPAYEWDGTVLAPIFTGREAADEKPIHVAVHRNRLLLGYADGGVTLSVAGDPLSYDGTAGAVDLGFGDEVTGFLESAATTTVIFARKRIAYLTGSTSSDLQILDITNDAGARRWTAQLAQSPIYQDERGFRDLTTTEALGGWNYNTISRNVQPLFELMTKNGVVPVASHRAKQRDIYRVFYDDRTVLSVYFGRGVPEIMQLSLGIDVTCSMSDDDLDTGETLLIGASDGYVYQFDAGDDFDGEEMESAVRVAFYDAGNPRTNKRWHSADLEVTGEYLTAMSFAFEFDYAAAPSIPAIAAARSVSLGGGVWDTSFWDNFFWDASEVGSTVARIDGKGLNCSMAIRTDSQTEPPHTISAATFNVSDRMTARRG